MDFAKLKNLLATAAYAELPASAAAALANEKRHSGVEPAMVTERGIVQAFANPVDGDTALAALEAFAATEHALAGTVRRALRWMEPANEGLDVGDPTTRAMIDQLVIESVLTEAQGGTIKGIAETLESDAEQLGHGPVVEKHVRWVREGKR